MEIIVGKTAGFCYGVKRAVEGTKQELAKRTNLYCLGELVHNRQVIEELEKEGLKFIDNINDAKTITIIRAHGMPKHTYELVKKIGIEIIDYTCPNVLKIHEKAEEYVKRGYYICLCGSSIHPENVGTISYCGENYSVIEKEEDVLEAVEEIEKLGKKRVLLISQTTYSLKKFYKIEQLLKENLSSDIEFVVNDTICRATEFRQKETEEISKKVECMIIIGGKNSSNTKKLYDIAKENCEYAICIETIDELEIEKIHDYNKIGIMAGASTPKQSIEDVIKSLEEISPMVLG